MLNKTPSPAGNAFFPAGLGYIIFWRLLCVESINGGSIIPFAGLQNRRREFRTVGRIGVMLCFQADCSARFLGSAAAKRQIAAVEKIGAVNLHAALIG